jgi:imidazolonepropionase-like amidohydrolase
MNLLIKNILLNKNITDIFIRDGLIDSVGENLNIKADKTLDGTGRAAIPSFINAHTHSAMTLMRSYADDLDLHDWLENKIWPFEKNITEKDLPSLESMAIYKKLMRENIEGYKMENGDWLNVLGDGNLVNIACGDGHPAEVMDTSFALQALSAEYLSKNYSTLKPVVYHIPKDIDQKVARLRLSGMGVQIDD